MQGPASPKPPWGRNGAVWAALTLLLALSLGLAYLPLGPYGTVAGLVIAGMKASLVVIAFMELGRAGTLARLAAMAGCLFALVLFGLTFTDVLSRP